MVDGSLRDYSLWVGLLLAHLVVPVGLWFAVSSGRPRFVGLGLYVAFAVLFTDVLLLLRTTDTVSDSVLVRYRYDTRIPVILLLVNTAVLALVGPGLVFYLGSTVLLVIVLYRALAADHEATSVHADLLLICGTTVLLVASQVLTVSYYIHVADTVNHTSTAIVLRDSGFLQTISQSRYYSFSAFHVFSSVGMQFTGLDPRLSIAVFTIVLFQVALLACYLFYRYLTASKSLALVGVVLVSVNFAFHSYSRVAHYQSLSFVFFCVFLFLLLRGVWSARDVVIAVPILVVWTATHHVSVLMAIALSSIPIGYLALRAWRARRDLYAYTHYSENTALMLGTFGLIFGTYWTIVTGRFREIIGWVFISSPAAQGITSRYYAVQSLSEIETLLNESVPFLVDSLHYSLLLALGLVGLWVLIQTRRVEEIRWRIVVVGAIPAALLYFPNPAWVPLEGLLDFNRWRLMVLPFLVPVPAAGVLYSLRSVSKRRLRSVATTVFLVALVFTLVSSGLAHPHFTDFVGVQKEAQGYLSDEEMAAVDFVYGNMADDQRVHSRSIMYYYFRQYTWALEKPYSSGQFNRLSADYSSREIQVRPGLTVMSATAFREQGIYTRVVNVPASNTIEPVTLRSAVVSDQTYDWPRQRSGVVYSNGDVVIQYETD